MSNLNICFAIFTDQFSQYDESIFEKDYQSHIKYIVTFLYHNPKFPITLYFTGPQIEWYERNHPEVLSILKELTSRKQVEILGGGYYSPIFPILFPVDRAGQIEKMNSILRDSIGKRPRGLTLFGNFWDPSLITTFKTSGMDYVFLDKDLIPEKKLNGLPLICGQQGKSLKVIPLFSNLKPNCDENFETWTKKLNAFHKSLCKNLNNTEQNEFIYSIPMNPEEFKTFLESSLLQTIVDKLKDSELKEFYLSTPHSALKNIKLFTTCYIPASMEKNIIQWSYEAFSKSEFKSKFPATIYDFLNTYPQNRSLYERMMYISMLIFQCKGGDKIRKHAAREKLWESQSGYNYVDLVLGSPSIAKNRQHAFRLLNDSERIMREVYKEFSESFSSFDYNEDGFNEYICQMEGYYAVIDPTGGMISELDVIRSSANYASSLSRIEKFDGFTDAYRRGIFVEHFLDQHDFANYKKNHYVENPVFSNSLFLEKKFNNKRNELYLENRQLYSSLKLPLVLRKNYTISSNSISVQYILKNDSPIDIKGIFVVELNLPQTFFDSKELKNQYTTELIYSGKKYQHDDIKFDLKEGISYIQITDLADKTSFVVEPNEDSGFLANQLKFKRPGNNLTIVETSKTNVFSLYWEINLVAGREIEKTINLSIVSAKKAKR